MEIVRNMLRRKLRTVLTIFGIVIGVFALTVMGAMSEYYNAIIDNAVALAGSVVDVMPASRDVEDRLNEGVVRRLRRLEGVKAVMPVVIDTLGQPTEIEFAPPELVMGVSPEYLSTFLPTLRPTEGRWLERGDDRVGVVGADVAQRRKLRLGDTIEWREKEIKVVGLLQVTRASPDWFVYVPLETARKIMAAPEMITAIRVLPEDPREGEALAQRIEREVARVKARSPKEGVKEIRQGLLVFQVILLSGAIIGGVVGGLSVINTMIQSVQERTREIGVKKAVGAEDGDIVREYVMEALLMGLIGGPVGLLLGWGATVFLNDAVAASLGSTELWLVTPRLVAVAIGFATLLAALAGLYPAWRAARLDPVQALRSE